MVNMEDGITLGVVAIIGIVAVSVVFGLAQSITVLSSVNNETLDLGTGTINGSTKALAHSPLAGTALTIKWYNGTTNIISLSNPQNFTVSSGGIITWNATAATGNVTSANRYWNATYQYEPSGYVSGTNATIVNNYTVLLLLGVLAFVGFFVAKSFGVFK